MWLRSLIEYYKEVGIDTCRFFKTRIIYKVPFIVATATAGFFLSKEMIVNDTLGQIIHGLIGLGLVIIGVFVGNLLFYTPTRIFKRLRPKLSVKFKRGEKPWFQEDPSEKLWPTYNKGLIYTYRIGLMNLGLETIKEINVRLTKIKPHPQDFRSPCFLEIMHNEPNNLQMTKIPEDGRFIDVFYFYRSFDRKNEEMGICHTVNRERKIPVQPYEIDITVISDNGGDSITKRFQFDPEKEDVKSMMEMVDYNAVHGA